MTPHSLVASLAEARLMGGTHHPLLGRFWSHVSQDDCGKYYDSGHLYEFHHVLASRKTRDGWMGQNSQRR